MFFFSYPRTIAPYFAYWRRTVARKFLIGGFAFLQGGLDTLKIDKISIDL